VSAGTSETLFFEQAIDPSLLVNGTNVLAVEIHQRAASSSDLSFDLELVGTEPPPPPPQTVSFQNGVSSYAGNTDTQLVQAGAGSNFGSGAGMSVDGTPASTALLRWDVSAIPDGSTIQAATITFTVSNLSVSTYEIYELRRSWIENQATWNVAATGSSWQVAGAQGTSDRGSTVLGTISASSTGARTISLNAAGLAVLQAWIDNPAGNFGFAIQDYGAADGLDFFSSETATISQRPKLTVTYAPV
jgi:hypothetical protein